MTTEYVDELEKVGYTELIEFTALHDSNYFYVHRSCAMWSVGVIRESNGAISNVGPVIIQSLLRKCIFCTRYGASMVCKVCS